MSYLVIIVAMGLSASPEPAKMCSVPCKSKTAPAKKAVVKAQPKQPQCCQAPITININQSQSQTQSVQGAEIIKKGDEAKYKYDQPYKWTPSWLGVGGYGAVGAFTCNPYVFATVGLRLKSEKLHLGADINTNFAYGLGLSLLGYPYIGETVSWHLNTGVLALGTNTFANGRVPRKWDWTLGTGLEFRLPIHWASVTVDYRYAVANPWAISNDVKNGLIPNRAYGNALMRSQLMLGLMVHSW